MGLEYEVCRFIPFVGEIEFETDRKDVFCFGAVKLAHIAKKYGFYPGSMFNDNHDFEVYSPYYGEDMLNHGGVVMSFTEPIPDHIPQAFFARPTKDTKVFSGQLFMKYSWDEYVQDCLKNDTASLITEETKVLIAPLKTIHQEIRCWIVDGEVVTMSQYKIGSRVVYENADNQDDIREFANKLAFLYQPAEAFVLDVARTEEGLKCIEINCINCSGFYEANLQKLIISLENKFSK